MFLSDIEKDKVLIQAADLYKFSPREAIEIPGHAGGRNLVYRIGSKSILRISTLSDRTPEDYQAEIEYIHFLSLNGASVADSIPSKNGNRMEMADGVVVAMFEIAKGEQIAEHGYRYRDGAPIEEYFENTGRTLGKIHSVSKKYKPQNPRFDFF